jgi:hypothetical protein
MNDAHDIDAYIRDNRGRYTRAALDDRLRLAGHDDAAIAAAWARVDAADGTERPSPAPATNRGVGTVLLIVLVIVGYAFVGFWGFLGIEYSASGLSGREIAPMFTLAIGAYVIVMLVGLAIAIRRIWRAPGLGRGAEAIWGALAMAILLLVGISGGCIVGTLGLSAVQNAVR